jgi:hypothetical protein
MQTTSKVHRYDDFDPAGWGEFIQAMHSGERFEVDEEMYFYWLEVLPPAWMNRTVTVGGEEIRSHFGFAEGYDKVTAFWTKDGRYFGQRTDIMNPNPW